MKNKDKKELKEKYFSKINSIIYKLNNLKVSIHYCIDDKDTTLVDLIEELIKDYEN